MQCKNCQLLGHTAKFWKCSPTYEVRSSPPYSPDVWTGIFCANCSFNHPPSLITRKKIWQAEEKLKIKITKKMHNEKRYSLPQKLYFFMHFSFMVVGVGGCCLLDYICLTLKVIGYWLCSYCWVEFGLALEENERDDCDFFVCTAGKSSNLYFLF